MKTWQRNFQIRKYYISMKYNTKAKYYQFTRCYQKIINSYFFKTGCIIIVVSENDKFCIDTLVSRQIKVVSTIAFSSHFSCFPTVEYATKV